MEIDLKKISKKLSTLDFIVILLAISAIVAGFLYFSREKKSIYIHTVSFEYADEDSIVPSFYWVANSIKEGDAVYTPSGTRVGEVVGVNSVDKRGARRYSKVDIRLDALFSSSSGKYHVSGNPLIVGETVSFTIGNADYTGMLVYVGEDKEPQGAVRRDLELDLKVSRIESWLARTYDTSFATTNSSGEKVFEILESRITPAEVAVQTDQGRIVRSFDPIHKDVYITAGVKASCYEDVCFYNEVIPLKVGLSFWTRSEKSVIEGESTKIIDLRDVKEER